MLSKVGFSFLLLTKVKYICKFIFKFLPSSVSLCGNMKSKQMTGQVTKESEKRECISLRYSLVRMKVLPEGNNKFKVLCI